MWRPEKTEYLMITCSWFSVWGLRPSCPCLKCQYHKSSKGLLLTISIMSGGITSGSMSWICRTCLLYSSFIVLNSVRQASILGYSRLEAQRKTSMRGFRLTEWTESNTLCFTHCFSGPVLLQSIQVFSVSARFSWSSSIMACCCTPGRSDRSNKNNYLRIQSNLRPRTSENAFIFYVFMAHCLEGLKNLQGFINDWLAKTGMKDLQVPGENRDMACMRTYSSSCRPRLRRVWWNLNRGSSRSGWKPATKHRWTEVNDTRW